MAEPQLSEEEMVSRKSHLDLVAKMTAKLEAEKAAKAASPSPRTPRQPSRKVSKISFFASPGRPRDSGSVQESPVSQNNEQQGPNASPMLPPSQVPSSGYFGPPPAQRVPGYNTYMPPFLAQQSPGFSHRANAGSYSLPVPPMQSSRDHAVPMTPQQRSSDQFSSTQQFPGNELSRQSALSAPQSSTAVLQRSAPSQHIPSLLGSPGIGTPHASFITPPGPGSSPLDMALVPNTAMMAGRKRRLSTPSAEVDQPARAKIFLQNINYPDGTILEVQKPEFESGQYMPAVRPVHPKPELTARSLDALSCGIDIERYSCYQKCRNKGTCVHFHFVCGIRRTPDGLICAQCSQEGTEEIICKSKRLCPFHNHDTATVANPINNLPIDYLATDEQKDRMVEILERAFRNEWTGSIEEIQYAMSAEETVAAAATQEDDVTRPQDNGQGTEDAMPHSAPAAMQTFGASTDAPFSMAFNESFDDSPYSMHGYAFEQQ